MHHVTVKSPVFILVVATGPTAALALATTAVVRINK